MDSMFNNADVFNKDISWWCVTNILSKPTEFDQEANLFEWQTHLQPQWGTCL